MGKRLRGNHFLVITIFIFSLLLNIINITPVQAEPLAFPNSGFELDPTNNINSWTWASTDWVWDGSITHGGAHSARVYLGSGNGTATIRSANIPVQASTTYTLTYWLRTLNATDRPSVNLYQYTTGQVLTGPRLIAHANISNGASSWNLVSYRFQTMPNAAMIRISITTYATGTFWFDDFGLDQGDPALYPFHTGFPVAGAGSIFYSSPVVVDINNDGANELLVSSGNAVYGWNRNGTLLPGFPLLTGDNRIQGLLAAADLNGDGYLEIVAGTKTAVKNGQGRVFLWDHTGALMSGWPKSVAWDTQYATSSSWVSSIVLADIDGDHKLEIVAGTTNNTMNYPTFPRPPVVNLYAWHADGSLVAGFWPNGHRGAAVYGLIAAGDLNGDGVPEVEVVRDHHFVNAYASNGSSLPGWPIETYLPGNGDSYNYNVIENIGFNYSAPVIADLDRDGQMEYIVAGLISGPDAVPPHNSGLLVLEPNGTRRRGWETPALGNGVLSGDDLSIQSPAIADLDNDGQLEIIVTTNDGWIRAYKPDKTVLWSFNYSQGAALGATEPVIGDIDGDGKLEIVFGTRVLSKPGGIYYNGPIGLWALKANGTVMPGFPLPIPTPGMMAAPTLADLDGNGKLEILGTTKEGLVLVWNTPTTFDPSRLPWPTGRHDLLRSAAITSAIPATPTGTPTKTRTPTITATPTGTPTRTSTPIITATPTGTPNRTSTPIITATPTGTPNRTSTPIITATPTRTPNRTSTPIITATPTGTPNRTSTPTKTPTTVLTPTVAAWMFCATEDKNCSFSGTKEVRYGASGVYYYRTFTNGTACTNAVFGDPIYGTVKECDYR